MGKSFASRTLYLYLAIHSINNFCLLLQYFIQLGFLNCLRWRLWCHGHSRLRCDTLIRIWPPYALQILLFYQFCEEISLRTILLHNFFFKFGMLLLQLQNCFLVNLLRFLHLFDTVTLLFHKLFKLVQISFYLCFLVGQFVTFFDFFCQNCILCF